VSWLSRLPNSALGRAITQQVQGYGVDTGHVAWSDTDRLGLYFWEDAAPPRPNLVIYDRQHSAASRITPADLPAALWPVGAAHLHLTGITLALSDSAMATAVQAAEWAQAAGWRISFDVNFRSKLWSAAAARQGCAPLMQMADLLIAPLRDVLTLFALDAATAPDEAAAFLRAAYPGKTIVLTLGTDGALGMAADGRRHHQPIFPTQVVDRLGSGDAFAAGLLYGLYWAADAGLATGLRWGAAMAAHKRTIKGDLPLVDATAVAELVASGQTVADSR
jgi:2-dehydro-3-deoxygluconokinase